MVSFYLKLIIIIYYFFFKIIFFFCRYPVFLVLDFGHYLPSWTSSVRFLNIGWQLALVVTFYVGWYFAIDLHFGINREFLFSVGCRTFGNSKGSVREGSQLGILLILSKVLIFLRTLTLGTEILLRKANLKLCYIRLSFIGRIV